MNYYTFRNTSVLGLLPQPRGLRNRIPRLVKLRRLPGLWLLQPGGAGFTVLISCMVSASGSVSSLPEKRLKTRQRQKARRKYGDV